MSTDASTFTPDVLLRGLDVSAIRIDESFTVREVVGSLLGVTPGSDVRDSIPALLGLEDDLFAEAPDLSLPFVSLGPEAVGAVALRALRGPDGAVWVLLRDAREEAELQQKLVQQHNSLALAQAELVRTRDAALAADRAKARFLANVSHELRTPLHVVIGNAALLAKEHAAPLSPEEIAEFAGDIGESGNLLLQLVEDMIDLSRSESGMLTLYEEWFDLAEVAAKVVSLTRDLPEANGVELVFDAVPDLPEFYADPRRIKQIMLNLLSNAIKAVGPGGRVELCVRRGDAGDVRLEVGDDGPGMSAEALEIARQPFGQPEARLRSKGTGLGLAIVQNLVALHEAELQIETAPGAGLRAIVLFGSNRLAPE